MKRVTKSGIMDIYGIGTKTAEQYLEDLAQLESDPALLDVYRNLIENYTDLIMELYGQIESLDENLEELTEEVEAVRILQSLPGAGIKTASRVVGEIQTIERFDSHNQLAACLGVACVDNQSGDHDQAKPIFPNNTVGKAAMMELASNMILDLRYSFEVSINSVNRTFKSCTSKINTSLKDNVFKGYIPFENSSNQCDVSKNFVLERKSLWENYFLKI